MVSLYLFVIISCTVFSVIFRCCDVRPVYRWKYIRICRVFLLTNIGNFDFINCMFNACCLRSWYLSSFHPCVIEAISSSFVKYYTSVGYTLWKDIYFSLARYEVMYKYLEGARLYPDTAGIRSLLTIISMSGKLR